MQQFSDNMMRMYVLNLINLFNAITVIYYACIIINVVLLKYFNRYLTLGNNKCSRKHLLK
jgi:hypothetical protein